MASVSDAQKLLRYVYPDKYGVHRCATFGDFRERRIRGRAMTGVGAASWVLYPAGEPVTMWQIEVLNKELLVHTGASVNMLTGPVKFREHFWGMM